MGAKNFLMAGCHLGHDVQLGDETVLANSVLIAGHCILGNRLFMGGRSVVHQFVRIGDGVMVQGNGAISMDVPPFCMVGQLNQLYGLNLVGLRRMGAPAGERKALKQAYREMYRAGKSRGKVLSENGDATGLAKEFFDFFLGESKKGILGAHSVRNSG